MTDETYPIVEVFWADSISSSGWQDLVSARLHALEVDEVNCRSVGYLIAETENYVLLALSINPWTEGHEISETMQIPKVAIKHRREML